jgi:hypothetical protein
MPRKPVAVGVSRQPTRSTSIQRGQPTRQSRRLLVVCGSEGNEARYIKGLKRHLRNVAVRVDVKEKGCAPLEVLEYGLSQVLRSAEPYDELWCVVDVDEFITSGDNLGKAVKRAARESSGDLAVTMVVTNPCFELWLVLHFADHRAHLANYAQVKAVLKKHMPAYHKGALDFVRDGYAERYLEAAERARQMDPTGTSYQANPSTNMWRLVEALRHRNGRTAPQDQSARGRR